MVALSIISVDNSDFAFEQPAKTQTQTRLTTLHQNSLLIYQILQIICRPQIPGSETGGFVPSAQGWLLNLICVWFPIRVVPALAHLSVAILLKSPVSDPMPQKVKYTEGHSNHSELAWLSTEMEILLKVKLNQAVSSGLQSWLSNLLARPSQARGGLEAVVRSIQRLFNELVARCLATDPDQHNRSSSYNQLSTASIFNHIALAFALFPCLYHHCSSFLSTLFSNSSQVNFIWWALTQCPVLLKPNHNHASSNNSSGSSDFVIAAILQPSNRFHKQFHSSSSPSCFFNFSDHTRLGSFGTWLFNALQFDQKVGLAVFMSLSRLVKQQQVSVASDTNTRATQIQLFVLAESVLHVLELGLLAEHNLDSSFSSVSVSEDTLGMSARLAGCVLGRVGSSIPDLLFLHIELHSQLASAPVADSSSVSTSVGKGDRLLALLGGLGWSTQAVLLSAARIKSTRSLHLLQRLLFRVCLERPLDSSNSPHSDNPSLTRPANCFTQIWQFCTKLFPQLRELFTVRLDQLCQAQSFSDPVELINVPSGLEMCTPSSLPGVWRWTTTESLDTSGSSGSVGEAMELGSDDEGEGKDRHVAVYQWQWKPVDPPQVSSHTDSSPKQTFNLFQNLVWLLKAALSDPSYEPFLALARSLRVCLGALLTLLHRSRCTSGPDSVHQLTGTLCELLSLLCRPSLEQPVTLRCGRKCTDPEITCRATLLVKVLAIFQVHSNKLNNLNDLSSEDILLDRGTRISAALIQVNLSCFKLFDILKSLFLVLPSVCSHLNNLYLLISFLDLTYLSDVFIQVVQHLCAGCEHTRHLAIKFASHALMSTCFSDPSVGAKKEQASSIAPSLLSLQLCSPSPEYLARQADASRLSIASTAEILNPAHEERALGDEDAFQERKCDCRQVRGEWLRLLELLLVAPGDSSADTSIGNRMWLAQVLLGRLALLFPFPFTSRTQRMEEFATAVNRPTPAAMAGQALLRLTGPYQLTLTHIYIYIYTFSLLHNLLFIYLYHLSRSLYLLLFCRVKIILGRHDALLCRVLRLLGDPAPSSRVLSVNKRKLSTSDNSHPEKKLKLSETETEREFNSLDSSRQVLNGENKDSLSVPSAPSLYLLPLLKTIGMALSGFWKISAGQSLIWVDERSFVLSCGFDCCRPSLTAFILTVC